jgi:hypothetical protein
VNVSSGIARHAVRTAVIATAVVGGLILVLCITVDAVVAHTLRSSAETRLSAELHQLVPVPAVAHLMSPTSMTRCWCGS